MYSRLLVKFTNRSVALTGPHCVFHDKKDYWLTINRMFAQSISQA
uniref:Uncharacterized protein n=1 Tax=Anguilla anguilla TaxID=7936 RepID=A0A0E9RLM2_ANGAN